MSLAMALMLAGCGSAEAPQKIKAAAPVAVGVVAVGEAAAGSGPLVSGVVRARQEAVLAFAVPGRVTQLSVNEGDRVAGGAGAGEAAGSLGGLSNLAGVGGSASTGMNLV
ncbi:MAG: hypothetical protein HC788_03030, partial [Sphingopyxis sp.]|nr:hypothetical protein [Sphingopyxis sp.]